MNSLAQRRGLFFIARWKRKTSDLVCTLSNFRILDGGYPFVTQLLADMQEWCFFFPQLGDLHNHKDYHKTLKKKRQEATAYFGMPRRKADESLPPEESLKSLENGRNDTGEFGLSHPSQDLYHPSFFMTFFRVPGSPLSLCWDLVLRHWCQTPKVGPAGAAAGPHKRIPSRKRKMRKTLRSAWGWSGWLP